MCPALLFPAANLYLCPSFPQIFLGVCLGILAVGCLLWTVHAIRTRRDPPKKGTEFLGLIASFRPATSAAAYQPAQGDDSADAPAGGASHRGHNDASAANDSAADATTVDRNISVRSVITLPAYRPKAGDSEQIIAREGERDGIDVVLELPTADDEEQLRNGEMQALYEIRLARRREIAEREQRRRERREARSRNDTAALEEISRRSRAASNNSLMEELRRDHERIRNERQRVTSSVSYADLGVARHDGSRIRASSTESERVGLLSDAASVAAVSVRSGAVSPMPSPQAPSATSFRSAETDLAPVYSRSRADSRTDPPRLSVSVFSSTDAAEADLGESDMPPHSPPGYEDVPLDDDRSGFATPHNEPPPGYPGPAQGRMSSPAGEVVDVATDQASSTREHPARESPTGSSGGPPRLPALQVAELPRIVVEPSSARPADSPNP
ncbi:hypothetical protein ACRALDRAFT_1064260 [Sodiomyces alcalophilus JCM 7366]|uniref:uncharacterized protein n=1 Tax=Sodiomyces alcalophilus JCM 7366 TaxID=591952 RepID=UPI0039B4BE93